MRRRSDQLPARYDITTSSRSIAWNYEKWGLGSDEEFFAVGEALQSRAVSGVRERRRIIRSFACEGGASCSSSPLATMDAAD